MKCKPHTKKENLQEDPITAAMQVAAESLVCTVDDAVSAWIERGAESKSTTEWIELMKLDLIERMTRRGLSR